MEPSAAAPARLELLGLPEENLSQIIAYIPKKSLFPLLTVSKRFHHLASAALYRNLWFHLAQSELPTYHKDPTSRLPEALHTFLTSSYDYAQHIKAFNLRMVESDPDQTQKRVASKFLAREEAGKLLNTAILVMIKRAKGLEQFAWHVPIECSPAIYQALSKASSLQCLSIHLDIVSVPKHNFSSFAPPPPSAPVFGGQPAALFWDPITSSLYPAGSGPVATAGGKSSKTSQAKAQDRNFGSIKGLQILRITAIDDLSCLEEIAECLKASSSSLRKLTLSLAESLVSKSQKPHPSNGHNPPPIQEDDASTDPGTPTLNAVGSGPSDLDLKREKQAQEQVLARIFSLNSVTERKQDKKVERSLKRSAKSTTFPLVFKSKNIETLVIHMMKAIQDSNEDEALKMSMAMLLAAFVTPRDKLLDNHQKQYKKLVAAEKFLSSYAKAKHSVHPSLPAQTSSSSSDIPGNMYGGSIPQSNPAEGSLDFNAYSNLPANIPGTSLNGWLLGSSSAPVIVKGMTGNSSFNHDDLLFPSQKPTGLPPPHPLPSQPVKKGKKKPLPAPITPILSSSETSSESESDSEDGLTAIPSTAVLNPAEAPPTDQDSDFDMDHPDIIESADEEADAGDDTEMENHEASSVVPQPQDTDVVDTSQDKGKQRMNGSALPSSVNATAADPEVTSPENSAKVELTVEESIQQYVRMTHGLSIKELELCFVPLKASILAKALDLTILQRLVLYNVGTQGAFWSMIEKLTEQGVAFSFQSLYTDDVSAAFVGCLACLPGLKSLHLLRRSSKEYPSTSTKTPATIDTIHKIGLVNHFETLQSLSITNLEDDSWDIDDKMVRVLASKAKKLRELAVILDSTSFHTFLRCLPGLRNLVALHLINIRASNTQGLIYSELKKLVLDVICYYPSIKLKYLAINLVTMGKISQIGEKPKTSIAAWYKKAEEQQTPTSSGSGSGSSNGQSTVKSKAKGKARATESSAPQHSSATALDDSDSEIDGRPNVNFTKQLRPSTLADSYVIFSNLVLKGRL